MSLLARVLGRSAERPEVTTRRPVDVSDGRGFNLEVVGESHHQLTLRRIADGRTGPGIDVLFRAWLLPDSNNPYDSNAVAIVTDDGMRVGHLPREWAQEYHGPLADMQSQDFAPYCVATVIGGYGHKKHFGVLLDIRDPKDGLVAAF
jgi:HIRAN domain-containing protein